MNLPLSLCFVFATFLAGCTNFDSTQVDRRNFAVDTYYPGSNEMQLAERHARQYWQKNLSRLGNETRYLAVRASSILAAELNADFSIKLDRSETSGSYFTQGIS